MSRSARFAAHASRRDYLIEGSLRTTITPKHQADLREVKSYVGIRHRADCPFAVSETKTKRPPPEKGPPQDVAGKKRRQRPAVKQQFDGHSESRKPVTGNGFPDGFFATMSLRQIRF